MFGSALFYLGFTVTSAGLILVVRPVRRMRLPTRRRALAVAAAGLVIAATALALPASESRVGRPATRLDAFMPAWQFHEHHTIRIAAPPSRVYDAIGRVKADEIALFRTLTWIRRGGRPLPESILSARAQESLIDVATRTGFIRLADEAPRELLVGTVLAAPAGTTETPTPDLFRKPLPPGFVLAAMNFLVMPDGDQASIVSTETRVYATNASGRWTFAAYWRVIYPGSAIIRRMWLRAIARRAMAAPAGAASRG